MTEIAAEMCSTNNASLSLTCCEISRITLVLTDSGGVQEEAPSLGKPVLVMREVTERMEGVEAGTAMLLGTNVDKLVSGVARLLDDQDFYQKMAQAGNPYGDGRAAERIVQALLKGK